MISPNPDVRPYNPVKGFSKTPWPLSDRPLFVEIGAGVGWFGLQEAHARPCHDFIAIEHTRTRFHKFERRLENHPALTNLKAIHADAIPWITQHLGPESVDGYYILYPNPYPKAKQRNKRWHAMPFMAHCIETLKPGGQITLATNETFYADEALQFFLDAWKLTLVERTTLTNPTLTPRTHFEKKYLDRGEICHNLVVEKPALQDD